MSERNGEWSVGSGELENAAKAEPAISESPASDDPSPIPNTPLPTPEELGVVIDRNNKQCEID